jgi:hypothetical protein
LKPPLVQGGLNDYQTPPQALDPLLPYLKKAWIIWEPAMGTGNLVNYLSLKGFNVIGTDIKDPEVLPSHDFLQWQPENFDCIITNPPYSLKQKFLERCYSLDRPFALLLPLTTFETKKRQALFKKHGVEVIFLPERINFATPNGKGSGAWFATMWLTWKLNLPKQMNFL